MKEMKMLEKIVIKGKIVIFKIYSFIYFLITIPYYGKNHHTNFISLLSKVENKTQIFLGKRFVFRSYSQLIGDFSCGDDVRFGYGCNVFGPVEMGNCIMVAPNCLISSGGHGTSIMDTPMIFQECPKPRKIYIKDNVWIGGNSVILKGVTIEKGAVVGAGSVVVADIPENAVAVGNPAKIIGYRK